MRFKLYPYVLVQRYACSIVSPRTAQWSIFFILYFLFFIHLFYFQGLGRRTFPDRCQHYSNNLITWNTNNDARSCYMASYQGDSGDDNSRYRRFPRIHSEPKPGSAPLETTTTKWFRRPDIPHKTPLHVLAITQEPFLIPNKWAYSYRPIWH